MKAIYEGKTPMSDTYFDCTCRLPTQAYSYSCHPYVNTFHRYSYRCTSHDIGIRSILEGMLEKKKQQQQHK